VRGGRAPCQNRTLPSLGGKAIADREIQKIEAEAGTMLTEIYRWFTEGFDTRDLQEAKQLLNELD
jgi:hypothetical protein